MVTLTYLPIYLCDRSDSFDSFERSESSGSSGSSDSSEKIKFCQNSKLWQLKRLNCDKTWKLELWQNSKTQIVTKPKDSNCDKTQKHKFVT